MWSAVHLFCVQGYVVRTHNPRHSPSPNDRSPCSSENLCGGGGDGGTKGAPPLSHQGAGVHQPCTTSERPGCPPQTYKHTLQKPLASNPSLWLRKNKGVSEVTQDVHDKAGARTHTSGPSPQAASPNREAMAPSTSLSRAVLYASKDARPPRCCDNNSTLPTFPDAHPVPGRG